MSTIAKTFRVKKYRNVFMYTVISKRVEISKAKNCVETRNYKG